MGDVMRYFDDSEDDEDFCFDGLDESDFDEEEDEENSIPNSEIKRRFLDKLKRGLDGIEDLESDSESESESESEKSERIVEVTDEEANQILQERNKKDEKKNENVLVIPQNVAKKASLGSQLSPAQESGRKKRQADENVAAPAAKKMKVSTEADTKKSAPTIVEKSVPETKEPSPKKKGKEGKQNPAKEEKKSDVAPGVVRQLAGGVKYEVLGVGRGTKIATIGKRVKVKYEGRLANGKQFDKGTLDFTIGGGDMIKGFDLGARGMLEQEKRRVFIPSRLAYGKQKVGGIPPNSDLIFEITLLSTK
ncbi:uncharacterized protein LOC129618341 [Condylostylus longicornis]|uniref:uncharacterized protein LOC129618341 n=1 Tax=Condylostylus longicornis TaxID=2530218 RepID=UPI00244E2EEC|nr:uncharacterized protein LOC129618341 [Condylostylus longicornis]